MDRTRRVPRRALPVKARSAEDRQHMRQQNLASAYRAQSREEDHKRRNELQIRLLREALEELRQRKRRSAADTPHMPAVQQR